MGTVVFSIDAELGWGFHDVDPPERRVEGARTGWTRLVELLDTYEVPATWAIVGHLLLDDCDGHHRDHPAGTDWFRRERAEWADRPDLRFGPDLVDGVMDAAVDHELASHSFSHVLFGAEGTTEEIARGEIELALAASQDAGVGARSFVFPRNMIGHRELLAEYGFTAYRGTGPPRPGRIRKLLTVVDSDPRLVHAQVDEYGLVDVPASLYLYGFEGWPKRVVSSVAGDPIVQRARRGIDAATREKGIFHMWLHPNNLVSSDDVARLESILEYLDRRRSALDIQTMAEVADRHSRVHSTA